MALIAMAVYDTEENGRSKYTERTINSLLDTVDFAKHRIFVVDNGSCEETKEFINSKGAVVDMSNSEEGHTPFNLISLPQNIGTARAVNKAWAMRKPGEHVIKMDNDVEIWIDGWVDEMEEYLNADPTIGIIGLKRKDLMETPWSNPPYKSTLRMLPHKNGDKWRIVEEVEHVIGTCQMYNYRLIDKMGGLMQPGLYGFDDTLSAVRCKVAGFKSCFIPHIDIDHIDIDENPYWQTKRQQAMKDMPEFNRLKDAMLLGQESIYLPL